jgi:hypothetical protein
MLRISHCLDNRLTIKVVLALYYTGNFEDIELCESEDKVSHISNLALDGDNWSTLHFVYLTLENESMVLSGQEG